MIQREKNGWAYALGKLANAKVAKNNKMIIQETLWFSSINKVMNTKENE